MEWNFFQIVLKTEINSRYNIFLFKPEEKIWRKKNTDKISKENEILGRRQLLNSS